MLDFLPPRLIAAVRHINLNRLYELRIRSGKPLTGNVGGKFCFLGERGIAESAAGAIYPSEGEVEETLLAASGGSVYAVENQIRRGFVTAPCGERLGLAGSYVYEGKSVLAIRSITSLCVRIPHEIKGCAEELYQRCEREGLKSVLLMSPPGGGKTTLLRDLSRLISLRYGSNILVVDERGELSAGDTGETSDVVKYGEKITAFTEGIRAMRPDVIVTDELLPEDYAAISRARQSGIVVFASAHLVGGESVPQGLFDYLVALNGLGEIGSVVCGG